MNSPKKENFFLWEEFKQLCAVNEQLVHRLEQLLKLSFGSKSERYLGTEQSPGQLRLGLSPEVAIEVTMPAPVSSEKAKNGKHHIRKEKALCNS